MPRRTMSDETYEELIDAIQAADWAKAFEMANEALGHRRGAPREDIVGHPEEWEKHELYAAHTWPEVLEAIWTLAGVMDNIRSDEADWLGSRGKNKPKEA